MSNTIKLKSLLLIPIILFTHITPIAAEGFVDVEEGDKYFVSISYLKEKGIINGYDDNTFRADEQINRAEALKMITLATEVFIEENMQADASFSEEDERPFEDTPLSAWYTPYLKAAKDKGIISGYPDGSYKPEQTVKLAEVLKILMEAAEISQYPDITEDTVFADTPTNEWFAKYVAFAKQETLLNISMANEIFPTQELTRGYLAEILYRFLRRDATYEFGKATFYGKASQGSGTASGETFDYNKFTAAHKSLPFGTMVKVTNLANGKSVSVKITDRGPYGHGRVIDLSSSAFEEIAWLGSGVIYVQLEIEQYPAE